MTEIDSTSFNSRSVLSNQSGIHVGLERVVTKHIESPYQKPIRLHNASAFTELTSIAKRNPSKLMLLDSGCGTGMSTIALAKQFPDHLVFGIDQSQKRLLKKKFEIPTNCWFLRANCEDIWRLCVAQRIKFDAHYILYPNPWPKSAHLQRRWHGHPVFPVLPALTDRTILRSNWLTYLDEFRAAWRLLTGFDSEPKALTVVEPLTLFERKYVGSGQTVFELEAFVSA